jgi:Coenzyme PQQ synthesis protein D (PqqD)
MTSYAVRHDNIVHDTIDGEVLAIRSDTGAYYSMTGTAATCWVALLGGHSLDEVAAAVASHHRCDTDEIVESIQSFADSLVEEMLLISGDTPQPGQPSGLPAETDSAAWMPPAFEKYTDMQDLLLFDPIHEVQPSGWPRAADPTT